MWFPVFHLAEYVPAPGDLIGRGSVSAGSACSIECAARRTGRSTCRRLGWAREGLMREHETGRSHSPWRWHPWFKRIFNTVTHVSAASLLAAGMASSLAARKNKSRNDDRGGRDHADRDRDGGNDKNREAKRE